MHLITDVCFYYVGKSTYLYLCQSIYHFLHFSPPPGTFAASLPCSHLSQLML